MRYRSRIPNPAHVVGDMPEPIQVVPGQEFDSPVALHHPELEPLDQEAKDAAAERARELEEQAAAYAAQVSGQVAAASAPDYRVALGLDPLPPEPELSAEERRIRGLEPEETEAGGKTGGGRKAAQEG